MKIFSCENCGNVLYFENRACGRCGHALGYAPEQQSLRTLDADGRRSQAGTGRPRPLCANAAQDGCNWLVPEGQIDGYCIACRHNGTVPDLSTPQNVALWRELEIAKHRLFYSLLRWRLPLQTRAEDPQHGLIFNFLADTPAQKVMTGHESGIITIALAEADDIERERRRHAMGEPYRTLLGHFRHEIGHHYWDILVRDSGMLPDCRKLFGDDRDDYQEAIQRHYKNGAPSDWQQNFVSAYASLHPWEDFAETWAHYLHIVDTLEMAAGFGIRLDPISGASERLTARIDFDSYAVVDFQTIIDAWLPFIFAINSVSRAIGTRDIYPFILAPPVLQKLDFIHGLIRRVSVSRPAQAASPDGNGSANATRVLELLDRGY